ncbi:hypothetical protein MMC07_000233, partial [Pseudocyphellaria aurata]|nr:hypothetical protein [Pseudocyphellaria aurata]
MPGVPPDAFAQVKKGLRGLFGRKKKQHDQPTPTTGAHTGSNSTEAPGAASSVPEPTKTEAGQPNPPQPSHTASPPATDSKNSESSPAPAKPSEPEFPTPPPKGAQDVNQKPEDLPSTAKTLTPDAPPPPAPTGEPGMSATSGPLDDQMAHEYAHLDKDDEPPATKKGEDLGTTAAAEAKK